MINVMKNGEVIVNLIGADGRPEVRDVHGMTSADIRKVKRIVIDRQAEFLAAWQEMHGGTD